MEVRANEQDVTSAQVAESEKGNEGVSEQTSSFGKFKDLKSLLDAYNSLEAEFTRRCTRVKELEGMLASENIKDKTATAVPSDTRREQGGQNFDGFIGEPLKTSAKFVKEGGVYEPVVTKPKTITEAGNYASQMFLLNKQGE